MNSISKMFKYLLDKVNDTDTQFRMMRDKIYPVGSYLYNDDTSFDPNTTIGGTWVQVGGRFLIGETSGYVLGATGGETTHKLTSSEMPSHTHKTVADGKSVWATSKANSEYGGTVSGSGKYYCACDGKNYTWNSNTGATGSGGAHNNMPPYLVVRIWHRTA